jgi:hypothetical protein
MADLGLARGWVIVGAGERRPLGGGIEAVPWADVVSGAAPLPFLDAP